MGLLTNYLIYWMYLRWQQSAIIINFGPLQPILDHGRMAPSKRKILLGEIIQHGRYILWIEQPQHIHSGKNGLFHNGSILFVLLETILVQTIPIVFA